VADELATMAVAIARRLGVARRAVEVVLVGGVFRTNDAVFHARVADGIRAAVPGARIARLDAPPVLGAALLALDEVGPNRAADAERRLRSAFDARSADEARR
jgi:hypothetical protein